MLNGTRQCQNLFLACWQCSFTEFALQQLPKQSQRAECLQCWDSKALILGQDIRHSLSFHVSTETLFRFYVTSHVFERATTTDCLGLHRLTCGLQYRSTSCYLEQREEVQLWLSLLLPVYGVSLFAAYIRFASPPLGHTSGLVRPVLDTPKYFLLVLQPHREELKGERESRLAEVDLTRAEVAHGMSKSWHPISSSLEWFIPWPSNRDLAGAPFSCYPSFSSHNIIFLLNYFWL